MGSAICCPAPEFTQKRIFYCRKCKKRRVHLMKFFEWYEPHANCLKCGDMIQFGGGE
jgi:hypothetical protein